MSFLATSNILKIETTRVSATRKDLTFWICIAVAALNIICIVPNLLGHCSVEMSAINTRVN